MNPIGLKNQLRLKAFFLTRKVKLKLIEMLSKILFLFGVLALASAQKVSCSQDVRPNESYARCAMLNLNENRRGFCVHA